MNNAETWRDCLGFENYEVSDRGKVRSKRSSKELKQSQNSVYPMVGVSKDGKRYTRYVHALVALAFIGSRPPGYQINHKDGCKKNNVVENLEYVTPQENVIHAYKNGLRQSKLDNILEADSENIRNMVEEGKTYRDIAHAFDLSLGQSRAAFNAVKWGLRTQARRMEQ